MSTPPLPSRTTSATADRSWSVTLRDPGIFTTAVDAAVAVADLGAWINNAGITRPTNLHEPDREVIEELLAINLDACIWGSSAAIRRYMAQGSGGGIVTISSIHARAACPDGMAYEVAKAGVEALMRYIALEYGPVGVRANSVAPAAVMTSMSRRLIDSTPDPVETERSIARSVPMRRIASAAEIAEVVAFLVSVGGQAGATYYAVDHTPTYLWDSASWEISLAPLPTSRRSCRVLRPGKVRLPSRGLSRSWRV